MARDNTQHSIQYIKENLRQFMLKVNRKHEPDMIAWLESQPNVQAYLKTLIRQDMEAHGISAPVPDPETT